MAERDIVVLEVVGGAGYAIRLVGKDGGVKLRRGAPVPLEEIFALVDAMPKRRVEIGTRPRPAGC